MTAPTITDTDRRDAAIAGLRALADHLEQTPDAPVPYLDARRHLDGRDEFVAAARALGSARFTTGSPYVEAIRDFGGGVTVHYQAEREKVCTPRIEDGKVVWDLDLNGASTGDTVGP